MSQPRALCLKCLRPASECWCAQVPVLDSPVRVVFLQHPRERRVPIGTARMAHLALRDSEFHVGTSFDEHARVSELLDSPEVRPMLLFPGPDAMEPDTLEELPTHLFVVDGTWSTASKLVRRNARLAALPKLGLRPSEPGRYRIRREPDEHGLATIEAVSQVLAALARKPGAFDVLLRPFDHMVESQLSYVARRSGPSRHSTHYERKSKPDPLAELWPNAVVVQAEANHLDETTHELLHLVAHRPSTGEWFDRVLRPRLPLGPRTCRHTLLDEQTCLDGVEIESLRRDWQQFCGDSVLVGWGDFPPAILATEALTNGPWFDLKPFVGNRLKVSGGAEAALRSLGSSPISSPARGRAAALVALHTALAQALVEQTRRSRGEEPSEGHSPR